MNRGRWGDNRGSQAAKYTEFNEHCAERVAWLNDRPLSDKEGSRREAFLDREAEELLPLPAERFELCEWRRCKVAPNYHVRIGYMHYSVPHALIGRTVDARVSAGKVCIFDGGDLVVQARAAVRLIASQLEPNEWYLRIEGELMADSILGRTGSTARYLDLDGPNMREYFAKKKQEEEASTN